MGKKHEPNYLIADDFDRLTKRANEIYASRKIGPDSVPYCAPECQPKIMSQQVYACMEALLEHVNTRLEAIADDLYLTQRRMRGDD